MATKLNSIFKKYKKGFGLSLNKKIPLYTVTWEEKTKNYYPYNSEKDGNQFYNEIKAKDYIKKLEKEKDVRKRSIKLKKELVDEKEYPKYSIKKLGKNDKIILY